MSRGVRGQLKFTEIDFFVILFLIHSFHIIRDIIMENKVIVLSILLCLTTFFTIQAVTDYSLMEEIWKRCVIKRPVVVSRFWRNVAFISRQHALMVSSMMAFDRYRRMMRRIADNTAQRLGGLHPR